METSKTTSRLTSQKHDDDCVEFLRLGIGGNVAKPNRYEASETKVESRTIPGLKHERGQQKVTKSKTQKQINVKVRDLNFREITVRNVSVQYLWRKSSEK